ncbi:putative RNA polymerase sigma factor FecI [Planctomycetes bacterium Poly30]|uniref:Putative RNA polymerase sigma factor FecI n=1 Tax=Saltatorellus ferox TaxID=2528018 RepID=A0A518EZY1_9BACT|nr:putative RNA polymerase sigma factor FecI [Planctomycetes bacterium Poly30]
MTTSDPHPRLEPLLQESAWLQSLARGLTHQEADRDDLVQDTWLSMLRGRARAAEQPKSWLGTVARRTAQRRQRSQRRREDHETLSFGGNRRAPGPEAAAERLDLAGVLVSELSKLDEPYRMDLYLRYYEGLTPTVIAERQGISASTLRGRLHRGRELLRQALVARDGRSWETWAALLLPLAGVPEVGGAAAGGLSLGTIMTMKLTALGALVGALSAGGAWMAQTGARSPRVADAPAVTAHDPADERALPKGLDPPLLSVTDKAQNRRASAPAPDSTEPVDPVFGIIGSGVIVDEQGAAVAGATVRLQPADGAARRTVTGAGGGWTLFELEPGACRFEVSAPGFLKVSRDVEIERAPTWARSVALRTALTLPVRFVSADGTAIPVRWLGGGSGAELGASLGVAATWEHPGTRLDAAGRFLQRSEAALFHSRAESDGVPAELGARYQGQLLLTAEPPLWVSLMFRDAVVEARRLDGSETELVFTVGDLGPFSGTVRLRMIDPATGVAITGGVTLDHPAGSLSIQPRLEGEILVFESVPPGRLRLGYRASNGATQYLLPEQRLRVGPGEVLDLGDVPVIGEVR